MIYLKTIKKYSPNFNIKKRIKNQIKFIILHYTGMRSEKEALNMLTNIQSEVASHYFIRSNGKIVSLVPDLYIAWHAGISSWKTYKSLNKNSIGIEIVNPGHQFGYKNFSKKQISSAIYLIKFLSKKYKINKKNILGHSDIAPDRKRDPGEKFPWKILHKNNIGVWHKINTHKLISLRKKTVSIKETSLFMKKLSKFGYPLKSDIIKNNKKYSKLLIKAFQRRFRPELISGKLDQECLLILNNLVK